jgi:hypothetical protein
MRRFFSPMVWVSVAAAGVLTFAAARAQVERPPVRERPPIDRGGPDDRGARDGRDRGQTVRVFEGESARGDFQAALDDAVRQALRSLPGADRLVSYRVREITGEQGGIRGANIIRVAIETTAEEGRLPPRDAGPPVDPPAEEPDNAGDVLRRSLRTELSLSEEEVDRAGPVTFSLSLENTTDQPVRVPFATAQKYDFEVLRNNRPVWRWSQGKFFAQSLTSAVIRPREEVTYSVTWNLRNSEGVRVPPGQYTVRGYLTARGAGDARISDTATLRVTDQQ